MKSDDRTGTGALVAAVRDSLDEHADRLRVAVPEWGHLVGDLRAVRRRRLRVRFASVTAAVVVMLVGVGVQRIVLPAHRGTGSAASSMTGQGAAPSALSRQPTRGSLASDRQFLDDLDRAVVNPGIMGSTVRFTSPADVRVLYAGDLDGYRIALIEAPYRSGGRLGYRQVSLAGPRGASVDVLVKGRTDDWDATGVVEVWVPGLTPDAPSGRGVFVVMSADGGQVFLARGPSYGADGRVSWNRSRLQPVAAGLWQGSLPWTSAVGTAAWVLSPGSAEWRRLGRPDIPRQLTADPAMWPPVHGHPTFDNRVEEVAVRAQNGDNLPVATSSRRVLWTGTLQTWRTDIIAITAASGAHVVHIQSLRDRPAGGGDSAELVTVLPKGPLDRVALVWPSPGPKPGPLPDVPDDLNWAPWGIGLLGPVGATTAVVTRRDGSTTTVPLTNEVGSEPVPDAVKVTFRDAQGHDQATTGLAQDQTSTVNFPPRP